MDRHRSNDWVCDILLLPHHLPVFASHVFLDAVPWSRRQMRQLKGHNRLNLCSLRNICSSGLDIGHSPNLPRLGSCYESSNQGFRGIDSGTWCSVRPANVQH